MQGQQLKIVTLTIKKKYYNEILQGTKRTEYRSLKEYYIKMFMQKPNYLRLHYQGGNMLQARVVDVKIVPTPEHLKTSGIDFGDKVFAISLDQVVEI